MIKENHFYSGTGGVYVVECNNENELRTYLDAKKEGIDFMRMPVFDGFRKLPNGNFEGRIKYYGLD